MKKIVLCVLAVFLFGSNCYGFGSKFKAEVEKETGAVKLVREVQSGGYNLITTSELQQLLLGNEEIVLIDTMPYEASYKKAHIPGAKQFLFPIPEMNEWKNSETAGKSKDEYLQLLGQDKEKKIVVYCGFVKCTRSHNGALWAKNLGYTNVFRHPGGIYAWKGAGYEVEQVE